MNLALLISKVQNMRSNRAYARIYHICDMIGLYSSLAIPFTFAGIVMGWYMQNPGVSSIETSRQYVAEYNKTTMITQPATLSPRIGLVVYNIAVYDSSNNIAYKWPSMEIDTKISPKLDLEFPVKFLNPGLYSVKGTLEFSLNPLKQSQIPINFGSVLIEGIANDY